jgi:hypothetical protein
MVLLLFCENTFGQVQKGSKEFNVSGSYAHETWSFDRYSLSHDFWEFSIMSGHFVTDKLELGVSFSFMSDFNDALGGLAGFSSYHFPLSQDSRTIPFVGGKLGFEFGDLNDTPLVLGGFGGVKVFISDTKAALTIQGFYTRRSFEYTTISRFGFEHGISVFF